MQPVPESLGLSADGGVLEGDLSVGCTSASVGSGIQDSCCGEQAADRSEDVAGGQCKAGVNPGTMLYLTVGIACVSPFMFGFSLGFTSPTLNTMAKDIVDTVGEPGELLQCAVPDGLRVFTEAEGSFFAAVLNVGAVVGALLGSAASHHFGPRKTITFLPVIYFLGYLGISLGRTHSIFVLGGGRTVVGLAVGAGSAVVPRYIGDISTLSLKGAMGACHQLALSVGIFSVNLLGSTAFSVNMQSCGGQRVNYVQWRGLATVGAIVPGALFALAAMPESPVWLSTHSSEKVQSASEPIDVPTFKKIDASAKETATSILDPMRRNWKCLLIATSLLAFQQCSGINAVVFFTKPIFIEAGLEDSADLAAMAVMLWQVVVTIVAVVLMDQVGRRVLLLIASACMGFSALGLAYHFYAHTLSTFELPSPPWVAVLGVVIYITGFSLGMGPVPWLIMADIFAPEIVAIGSAIATSTNWACSFLVTLTFEGLQHLLTPAGTFLFFAGVCFLAFFFVKTMVPETKGKSVQEVLQLFGLQESTVPACSEVADAEIIGLLDTSVDSLDLTPSAFD